MLFDIVEGMPAGKALDLAQAAPVEGFNAALQRRAATMPRSRAPTW